MFLTCLLVPAVFSFFFRLPKPADGELLHLQHRGGYGTKNGCRFGSSFWNLNHHVDYYNFLAYMVIVYKLTHFIKCAKF